MGVPFTGQAGGMITEWGTVAAGNFYSNLFNSGTVRAKQNAIQVTAGAPHLDATGGGDSVGMMTPDILSWTGRASILLYSSPISGRGGLATYSSLGTAYIRGWTLSLRSPVHDITAQAATPPTWADFRPDVIDVSGTIEAQVETGVGNAPKAPDPPEDAGESLVLKLRENNGGTDDLITLDKALLQELSIDHRVRQVTGAAWRFTNGLTGTVVANAGGTTQPFYTNDATPGITFGVPTFEALGINDGSRADDIEDITITLASGRTLTGYAFWSAIDITARIGELVRCDMTIQGRGALTIN